MLTRSPVPPASANASPSFRGFHYATAHSPLHSPARISAALSSRRQSASSPSAAVTTSTIASTSSPAALPRPKRYVAVDAATQYSPMEPFNYRPTVTAPATSADRTPLDSPPTPPGPTPMEPGIEQGVDPDAPQQSLHQPAPTYTAAGAAFPAAASAKSPSTKAGPSKTSPLSPAKRRSSPGPSAVGDSLSVVNSPATLAKRPKISSQPPKVLPDLYELCPVEDMVVLIANMLGELIETNDALALKSGHLTRFHSRTAPGISVLDYLLRLAKHATLSPPLLLSMVYYIDRLCALYPDFNINTLTVHRFLITAATVAAKGLSDSFWNNSTYARVGGVRVAELKLLELEFLCRVDWKIVPNPEVLVAYYKGLVERSSGYILESEQEEQDGDEDDDSEELDDGEESSDGGSREAATSISGGGDSAMG